MGRLARRNIATTLARLAAAATLSGCATAPPAPSEPPLTREQKTSWMLQLEDQRILRVPAGYMRNKTQERIEEIARERAASTIDLGLVEEGIEIGKKMMAEMIANYSAPTSANAKPAATTPSAGAGGSDYLNEVRPR